MVAKSQITARLVETERLLLELRRDYETWFGDTHLQMPAPLTRRSEDTSPRRLAHREPRSP